MQRSWFRIHAKASLPRTLRLKACLRCPSCLLPLKDAEFTKRHLKKCCTDLYDEEAWKFVSNSSSFRVLEEILCEAKEMEERRRHQAIMAAFGNGNGSTKGRRAAAQRVAQALGVSQRRANALLLGASRALPLRPWPIPLSVIHECDSLLVVNKPPGIRAQPRHRFEEESLLNAAIAHLGQHNEAPKTVHRLDMNTSGVTVFAKTKDAARSLQLQFEGRQVCKRYLAVVDAPDIPGRSWITQAAIDRVEEGKVEHRCVETGGKAATTRFVCLSTSSEASLVAALPVTGRTHQIRLHLQHDGRPIIGDELYGKKSDIIARHALHATVIQLLHPQTRQPMVFVAPLPTDILEMMDEKGISTDGDWSAACTSLEFLPEST